MRQASRQAHDYTFGLEATELRSVEQALKALPKAMPHAKAYPRLAAGVLYIPLTASARLLEGFLEQLRDVGPAVVPVRQAIVQVLNTWGRRYSVPTRTACRLCGGNAGQLNDKREHNLCSARAEFKLLTPSLGDAKPPRAAADWPNKGCTYDRACDLAATIQGASEELQFAVADRIHATGECLWHAVSVVTKNTCSCAGCK